MSFVKRINGKRRGNKSTKVLQHRDLTAHNHYNGSPNGVQQQSRVIQVLEEEPPPAKRPRITDDPPMDGPATDDLVWILVYVLGCS